MTAALTLMIECHVERSGLGQLDAVRPVRYVAEIVVFEYRPDVARKAIAHDPQIDITVGAKCGELREAYANRLSAKELQHLLRISTTDSAAGILDAFGRAHVSGIELAPDRESLRLAETIEEFMPHVGRNHGGVEITVDFIQIAPYLLQIISQLLRRQTTLPQDLSKCTLGYFFMIGHRQPAKGRSEIPENYVTAGLVIDLIPQVCERPHEFASGNNG